MTDTLQTRSEWQKERAKGANDTLYAESLELKMARALAADPADDADDRHGSTDEELRVISARERALDGGQQISLRGT